MHYTRPFPRAILKAIRAGVGFGSGTETTIRQKLEESFSEKLPSTQFQIGYIEKRCNAKRWIEEPADCKSMYDSYRKGDMIILWYICVKDINGDAQPAVGAKQQNKN